MSEYRLNFFLDLGFGFFRLLLLLLLLLWEEGGGRVFVRGGGGRWGKGFFARGGGGGSRRGLFVEDLDLFFLEGWKSLALKEEILSLVTFHLFFPFSSPAPPWFMPWQHQDFQS